MGMIVLGSIASFWLRLAKLANPAASRLVADADAVLRLGMS